MQAKQWKRNKNYRKECMYFLQGRCKFGDKCHNSHAGYTQALMIRHGESIFNQISSAYPDQSYFEEPLKSKMHLNQECIDSGLSELGQLQCKHSFLPQEYTGKSQEIDIVFVSPLNRALETADLIIKNNYLQVTKIIVLPQLTEVMSKICDLSHSISQKKKKYKHFDFAEMDRFIKEAQRPCDEDSWQDRLVDPQYFEDILTKEKGGPRYMRILKNIFPTPLENRDRCFSRALEGLELMKEIVLKEKAQKVLMVSHNRILKYLDGRFAKGRVQSFQNCEMRGLVF